MIIGIGGVSRAGKTTLAYKIREWIGKDDVCILHQDKYIMPEAKIPRINDHLDWEHPDSLDFKKLQHLALKKSQEYPYVIVEGLMVFYNKDLLKLMENKIYINITKDAFLNRKTLDNRWGKEPKWYIEHIWESHFKYGLISEKSENVLHIDGEACCLEDQVQEFLKISKTTDHDN